MSAPLHFSDLSTSLAYSIVYSPHVISCSFINYYSFTCSLFDAAFLSLSSAYQLFTPFIISPLFLLLFYVSRELSCLLSCLSLLPTLPSSFRPYSSYRSLSWCSSCQFPFRRGQVSLAIVGRRHLSVSFSYDRLSGSLGPISPTDAFKDLTLQRLLPIAASSSRLPHIFLLATIFYFPPLDAVTTGSLETHSTVVSQPIKPDWKRSIRRREGHEECEKDDENRRTICRRRGITYTIAMFL